MNTQANTNSGSKLTREFFGLFFIFCSILLLFSLITYDPRDPSLNHVVRGAVEVRNLAGIFGAYLSALFVDLLGFSAFVPVAFLACLGLRRILDRPEWQWWRWLSFVLAGCALSVAGVAWGLGLDNVRGGGLLGNALYSFFLRYFNPWGTGFVWFCAFVLGLQLLFDISWIRLVTTIWQKGLKGLKEIFKPGPPDKSKDKAAEKPTYNAPAPAAYDARGSSSQFNTPGRDKATEQPGGKERETAKKTLPDAPMPQNGPANNVAENRLPLWEKLSLAPENPDDEDTPPWVRDLENGVIGLPPAEQLQNGAQNAPQNEEEKNNKKLRLPVLKPFKKSEGNPLEIKDFSPSATGAPNKTMPGKTIPGITMPSSTTPGKQELALAENTGPQNTGPKNINPAAATPLSPPQPDPATALDPAVVIDDAPAPIPPAEGLPGKRPALPFARSCKLPGLDLLKEPDNFFLRTSREELEVKGHALMTCLKDFNIQAELVRITPGPVVTMFELRPAPGVKVSRIAALSDDIAMNLKSIAVRVQAPIPGTDTVGIEIPNDRRENVSFKELLASAAFQKSPSLLTLGLGKDISGGPAMADLATMPHLLVAGATGSGKSIFLNSVMLSLLFKARPEEVKLLLIDPKRVEMAAYVDLPHLIHPVVTDMTMAKNALDWAAAEMDKRYESIARLGVRNITSYNEKLAELRSREGIMPDSAIGLEAMPYLVIIIDELADLMLVAGKEVEHKIMRLAQLARAAGIHLILATQRPSVDVVTGLIKANFPCRISFQVTSKHDSRTILDAVGAEYLLGKGDMLFKSAGGRFQRMHGAFVPDADVAAVTAFWRKQQAPNYQVDFSEWVQDNPSDGGMGGPNGTGGTGGAPSGGDAMYDEALEFVLQQGQASISLLQRRFRIGFNRAARLIDQMEQEGLLGPSDGAGKPRKVIR